MSKPEGRTQHAAQRSLQLVAVLPTTLVCMLSRAPAAQ